MKKILSILVLLFFWCEINAPAQQIITATVTITNVSGTANGETILINSTTRTWTNVVTTAGTQILTATNIPMAATNLFLNYAVTPEANVTASWNSSNVINFQCYAGSGLIASISSGWATISFSTNTLTQAISVRVPPSAVGNYEQSNVESGLAQYIRDNKGTNTVGTNAPMFSLWYAWISSLFGGGGNNTNNAVWLIGGNIAANIPSHFYDLGVTSATDFPHLTRIISEGDPTAFFVANDNGVGGYSYVFGIGSTNNTMGTWNILSQSLNPTSFGNSRGTFYLGGDSNNVSGLGDFSIGGFRDNVGGNTASPQYSFTLGGESNLVASGVALTTAFSEIIGGIGNNIAGSTVNVETNDAIINSWNSIIVDNLAAPATQGTTIIGGYGSTAGGNFDFLSGLFTSASFNNDWMWSDGTGGAFTATSSNQFLINASGGVGINTATPAPYTLNVNGSVNALAYYLNGVPFSGGGSGGGGGGTTTNRSVGTLYSLTFSPIQTVSGYAISNIVVTGIGGANSFLNGTYANNSPVSGTYNYAGAQYYFSTNYINGGNSINFGTLGIGNAWNLLGSGVGLKADNYNFNLADPLFNNTWQNQDFVSPVTPVFTPTLYPLGVITNYSASPTVVWAFGDNWNITLVGVTNFTTSLAQDWRATNSAQVETHQIFLSSTTNCTLSFTPTNRWIWQNRQGLLAYAPPSIGSNETMTITIEHLGTQTNWLAIWDTTAAISSGSGLTVTNWTLNSLASDTNFNTAYTYSGLAGMMHASFVSSSGGSVSFNYTNGGVGYYDFVDVLGTSTNSWSVPINNGSTFSFHVLGGSVTLITNVFSWQLPH